MDIAAVIIFIDIASVIFFSSYGPGLDSYQWEISIDLW